MRTGGCYGGNCQKVRGAYPTGLWCGISNFVDREIIVPTLRVGTQNPTLQRPSETRLTWFEATHHQSQQAGVGYAMRTGGCYGGNCQKVRGAYPTGLLSLVAKDRKAQL
jgi:hypothetical protein